MLRQLVRFLLLAGVILIPMRSLEAAAWVAGLERAFALAAAGLLFGAAITVLRPRDWPFIQAFGLLLGLAIVALTYAPLAGEGTPLEQLDALYGRLVEWVETISAGRASSDTLILSLTLGLLGWTLGLVGATSVLGAHNAWWVVVPSATILLVNISVGRPGLIAFLLPYMPLVIALIGQVQLDRWQHHWRYSDLPIARGVFARATAVSLLLSVLLVGVAWALPSLGENESSERVWQGVEGPLAGPWRDAQASMDRLFSATRGEDETAGAIEFDSSMEPRQSAENGEQVVFEVESPHRGYWRAATYDAYTGRAMNSTLSIPRELPAEEAWPDAGGSSGPTRLVEQRYHVVAAQTEVVLGMEAPVQLSEDAVWHYRETEQDVQTILLASPLGQGRSYTVLSRVPDPSLEQLRDAGDDYPAWVRPYLQLPPNLPQRVRTEAEAHTAAAPTNLDKALAIESYLRSLTYSLQVPVPPADRDWVDFLLFDSQVGYCDYFATAMAVMLRTQGIPARVASGFASGEYDPERGVFTVRQADAHSWVEAYFPGHGWILFEPSAIRDLPDRRSEADVAGLTPENPPTTENFEPPAEEPQAAPEPSGLLEQLLGNTSPAIQALVTLAAAVVLAVLAALSATTYFWRRGLSGLARNERPYAELRRLFDWLGPRAPASLTPFEFARWASELVPQARAGLSAVAGAYAASRYGGARAPRTSDQFAEDWPTVRRAVFKALLADRLRRLTRPRADARALTLRYR